jgi:hypothetical protein
MTKRMESSAKNLVIKEQPIKKEEGIEEDKECVTIKGKLSELAAFIREAQLN